MKNQRTSVVYADLYMRDVVFMLGEPGGEGR